MLGVLLMSFGGPNGPDDVRPFLANVAAGRRIPPSRLEEVVHHYLAFGGVSPINRLNGELVAALQSAFDARSVVARVVVGNRNWLPYFHEALAELVTAGCSRIVLLPSSAYEAYSTCRQYLEDAEQALSRLAADGVDVAGLEIVRATPIWATDAFVQAQADCVAAAGVTEAAHVVFVTHSIPTGMDAAAGGAAAGGGAAGGPTGVVTYAQQTEWVSEQVAAKLGITDWSVAYCSRSGPPHVPWLEPDICDELSALARRGVRDVVVVPVGFINDHMEVIFDLDTEAAAVAGELGMSFTRAATVGVAEAFVSALVESVLAPVPFASDCCYER